HGVVVRPRVGLLRREQLVKNGAERVDVAAVVEVRIPLRLLGRHVAGGAEQLAGAGDRRPLGVDQLGDAEIQHLHQIGAVAAAGGGQVGGVGIAGGAIV